MYLSFVPPNLQLAHKKIKPKKGKKSRYITRILPLFSMSGLW